MRRELVNVAVIAAAFGCAAQLDAAANLVTNAGFEDGTNSWEVRLRGDWVKQVEESDIASVSPLARTGQAALSIDTTALNPGGTITDELRTPKRLKYEILVTQKVAGIKPNCWYLAKFHIKSSGIAIDEGLELVSDIQPWPLRTYGESEEESHWKDIHPWERRLFLPQAPIADNEYHEYVLLKETYSQTDTLEVGVRIRAPWTGQMILDDVELVQVDPDRDMTKMEKLLAMRGAKPIQRVRELNRETDLVRKGQAAADILLPDLPKYKRLGRRIRARIRKFTGAELPVRTKLEDVSTGTSIIAVGSMMKNELVARLHFNRYVRVDAASPGPGGYVIWTVAEPYGLAPKQNVVVVAGSDAAGESAAVDAFCGLLKADGKTLRLPYLHTVFPKRTIEPEEREVPRGRWGFDIDRNRWAGFSKWYLPRWLETGDLEVARLARKEILMVADRYLEDPYFQTAWDTYEVGWAWDSLEEAPVFSDEDRLKITNALRAYLHMRPQETSGWARMVPRLARGNPTWNHQAKALSGAYTVARYFKRFYPREAHWDYYLAAPRNAFEQQALYSKPQENSGNYWLITMRFALSYYLGEWDKTFFDNGALRRYAEYFAVVCNNKGWLSGFGDTYYCYHGAAPRVASGAGIGDPALAFWYYRDGRILWWLEHCGFQGYERLYHQDVKPVEWKGLLGVRRVPLETGLYDPRTGLPLWGSGGEGTDGPVGDVKYEETFDKISFRHTWDPQGQYLLLEGNGRGIHSGRATNQICKLSILGEDLLIGSCYRQNNIRRNDSVLVVKDGHIDDPDVKGKGRFPFQWWHPLWAKYPSYAAVDAMADLPHTGFTRTALRDYQGTNWYRSIFWAKGKYFAMIDEIVANEPGTYYVESNLKTCPYARKTYPQMTPRTWRLLADDRGIEETLETSPEPTSLYIVTDGASKILTEEVQHEYINALMVHQVSEGNSLSPGDKVTFINLFYGDRPPSRANYRLKRLGPTEGIILQGEEPVAYFGCGQDEPSKAVLPIKAKMYLLTGDMLAVVDGASAAQYFSSERPVSREIGMPGKAARQMLQRLSAIGAARNRRQTNRGKRGPETMTQSENAVSRASGPLKVHPDNPRYFADATGRPVYLTGAHTWSNFKDMGKTDPPPPFDFDAYLNFLQQHNHNFIRLWTWELTTYTYDGKLTYAQPFAWPRTGPGKALDGKPKFDLSQFDQAYFDRLRARVEAAREQGIYVSIMLFEGHGLHASQAPWCWNGHPLNAENNVNGINGDPDGDGRGLETHTLEIPAIAALQKAYVRKVIDTVNGLDNVLYEIANESGAYSTEWQYDMIRCIHEYEKTKPKQHPVGMTFQWARETRGTNANLFNSPADWISPNPEGGYRDNPPAGDGKKVILSDTDHLWGIGGNQAWVWKSFCRGLNPIFMDPYRERKTTEGAEEKKRTWTDHLTDLPTLDPEWDPIRRNLGYTRAYADRMNLAAAVPHNELASTQYCLATPGQEYLVYLPEGGKVTIDLSAAPGELAVEWLNPTTGETMPGEAQSGGGSREFAAPFAGDAVLYLVAKESSRR